MVGKVAKVPMNHRILRCDKTDIDFSGDPAINLSDTVFEFLDDEGERSSSSTYSICDNNVRDEDDENGEKEIVEDNDFWENQYNLLHATLCRTTSAESRIRSITKETLKEAKQAGNMCACQKPVNGGCRSCLMNEVFRRLQNAGFNSAICKSKWKSLSDIPSGEHTFVDVVENSNPKRGEIRIIIELNFRGEFEMARSNEEYGRLVTSLPEVFVGKIERLLSVIKIMCTAAKRCMKERKMHLGPWRKQKYMQAKWLRTCHRTTAAPEFAGYGGRAPRPTASMLTVDLLDHLPGLHRTAVAVV
nr:uncharacterized protein LOC109164618 [Ipomoea batatas]